MYIIYARFPLVNAFLRLRNEDRHCTVVDLPEEQQFQIVL